MAVTTPSASPARPVGENSRLVCTSRVTPKSAAPRPARNMRLGRWRRKIQAARVTKRDARLARSVEFATEVDRKSTRLNSSHSQISYAVFCLKKKKKTIYKTKNIK